MKKKSESGRFSAPVLLAVLVTCLALASGDSAWAAKKHVKKKSRKIANAPAAVAVTPITLAPIEDLQEALYSKKNKKDKAVTQLKQAYDALAKQQWATAKSRASGLISNTEFGDYARWISATADLKLAHAALDKKQKAQAKQLAQSVPPLLSPIASTYPYSPLLRAASSQMGQADLIVGRLACEAKKWSDCQKTYEKGFQRLLVASETVYIAPADVSAYAGSCVRHETEICASWVQKFAFLYPKVTPEFKALVKVYPRYADGLPRSNFPGKMTLSYKAPDADQVSFDAAMALYLDKKYSDASQAFRKFGDEYPRSSHRFRARFWLAECLRRQKKEDEAKKVFSELLRASPLTYYGLLASIESGEDIEVAVQNDNVTAQDFDPFLQPAEIVHLRRAQKLLGQKAYDLAAVELRDLKARDQLSSEFLIYLAMLQSEAHSYTAAFPILNDLIARGHKDIFSQFAKKIVFPVIHLPEVKKYAEENKIDPVLVLSLMKQESAFDVAAISSSGALGLMQLMPATAAETSQDQARLELISAESNIKTGTRYLSQVLNRFQGNIVLALAAYNAGPAAVARWTKASPTRDMLEFIETIPYRETREYVSAIVRNYFWYSRLLAPEKAKGLALSYFWGNYGPHPNFDASPVPSVTPTEEEQPQTAETQGPEPAGSPEPGPSASAVPAPNPRPAMGIDTF